MSEGYALVGEIEKKLLVEGGPREQAKLRLDLAETRQNIANWQAEYERLGGWPGGEGRPPKRAWRVLHFRNPYFTGREEQLKRLEEGLKKQRATAVTQAIAGLGGIGKTQLATEYTYRHVGEYEVVWWVRAEEGVTLAADYGALAVELGLVGIEVEIAGQVAAAKRWLEGHQDWLVVFDNAEKPEELRGYLPKGTGGHVLITSRNQHWGRLAGVVGLVVMRREEAVRFLLERTGQKDAKAARELAELLGDLPLALEQAAAYMTASGRSMGSYLPLFRGQMDKVLARREAQPDEEDYPASVLTTWQMAFERLEEECAGGAKLLKLLSFVAAEALPVGAIEQGKLFEREMELDEALAGLRKYSLVEMVGEEQMVVHRLVQAVTRARLGEEERKAEVAAMVEWMNGAFPFESDKVESWEASRPLVGHLLTVAAYAEEGGVAPGGAGQLLNQVGRYLRVRAEYGAARECLERAVKLYEAAYRPYYPKVATVVNNLGNVLQDLGDLEGARVAFERALQIDAKIYGTDHPKVAIDINNLGLVLRDLGDLEGARAAFEQALGIGEKVYGSNHPDVARDVNNLGGVLHALGDLEGARAAYERALGIFRRFLGEEHGNTRIVRGNLEIVEERLRKG